MLATVHDRNTDPLYRRMNRTDHDYERYSGSSECPCCWTWAAWLIPPDFGAELLVRCYFPAGDIPLITECLIALASLSAGFKHE